MDSQWIHIESIFRIVFNKHIPGQSHNCLKCVCMFTLLSVNPQLQAMQQASMFMAGDCVMTFIRHKGKAYLATMQATHLYKAGKQVYSIPCNSLLLPASCIELCGQILHFTSCCQDDCMFWNWDHTFACLHPLKSSETTWDILNVWILCSNAMPVGVPTSSDGTVSLQTWSIPHPALEDTSTNLWHWIKDNTVLLSKLSQTGPSPDFPYCSPDGMLCSGYFSRQYSNTKTGFALQVLGFKPLPKDKEQTCIHCYLNIPGTQLLAHMSEHILKTVHGAPTPSSPLGTPVS